MKIADLLEFEDGRRVQVMLAVASPFLLAYKGLLKIVEVCKRR
jgi:hypothetical protein